MSKAVFLFSGQGAQKTGMGKDLIENYPEAKALFDKASATLDLDLVDTMFGEDSDKLTRTSYCQPALYLHGLAVAEIVKHKFPHIEAVATAGLSLGEFTAHAFASSLGFEEGLKLVAKRGAFMEDACEKNPGAMAAMIGGDEAAVVGLAEECDVDVANFNSIGQIVLSGKEKDIDKAVAEAKGKGIRMGKKLKVAGAYHSRLMQSAQEELAKELAVTDFSTPAIPVICNFKADNVSSQAEIRETLEKQVSGSVRWTMSMQKLIADGHTLFIECGPGKILAGLMGRIDKSVTVVSIEDLESLEKASETLV